MDLGTKIYNKLNESQQQTNLNWIPQYKITNEKKVIGGNENGKNLYVCQGNFENSIHPGKTWDN